MLPAVRVQRFSELPDRSHDEAVAALLGRDVAWLRDGAAPWLVDRWIAFHREQDGDVVCGVLTARRRPDGRCFLSVAGGGRAELVAQACRDVAGPLYTRVDGDEVELFRVYSALGFESEMVEESFVLSFDTVLRAMRWWRVPRGFSVLPASSCDPARLFDLDNELRNYVPGCDGWAGDWEMFESELEDDAAYFVAIEQSSGRYVGLVRIWHNPSGPRFGLVGVLHQFRPSRIALALLRPAFEEAATWGSDSLTAATSLSNPIHSRLAKIATDSLGQSYQMVLR